MTPYEEMVEEYKALLKLTNEIVLKFIPDDELSNAERLLMIRLEHYRSKSHSLKVGGIRDA